MSWLRLQWRGALVVLVAWAGLAAAQSPQGLPSPQNPPAPGAPVMPSAWPTVAPPLAPKLPEPAKPPVTPPSAPASSAPAPSAPASSAPAVSEHLVTVNENGKSILCRVVQTWKLADGSTAHQLQAIESGEFITIFDDHAAPPTAGTGLAKRIFHWGLRNSRTAPPGSPLPPIPPGLMVDSGLVVNHEINPPAVGCVEGPDGTAGAGMPFPPCASCSSCTAPQAMVGVGPTSPYHVGAMGAGQVVSVPSGAIAYTQGVMPQDGGCASACTDGQCSSAALCASPAPSLRDKVKSWFAPKESRIVSLPAPPMRPEVTSLAIVTPPSAAQSMQTEVVVAQPDSEIVKIWRRPLAAALAKTRAPVAHEMADPDAKFDMVVAPERFAAPKSDKVKPSPVGVAYAGEPVDKSNKNAKARNQLASGELPMGAQSVLAARSGLNGPIAFIPMQTPVVPQPWRAPLPPDPKMPDAPQLNAFVNAFSPPPAPRGANGPQVYNQGPPAMAGYGPAMPYPPAMAYGYPPMMPGAMPPYGMMPGRVPPYAMANPYLPPQGMPFGYPAPPAGYPMPMSSPAVPASSPRQYQGPQPPNPFGTNVPASYTQPEPSLSPPMGFMPPMAMAQVPPAWQIGQLIDLLRDSAFPGQREMAANSLAAFDWRANPQVAAMLTQAARRDPAPTVRAACVLNLMRMHVATEAVRDAIEALRTDADPRVRDAAEQAITRLAPAPGSARAN